jgi:hypothetical protein
MFKAGDAVVIDNLERQADDPGVVDEMKRLIGFVQIVHSVNYKGWITFEDDGFIWHPSWIRPAFVKPVPLKVGMMVRTPAVEGVHQITSLQEHSVVFSSRHVVHKELVEIVPIEQFEVGDIVLLPNSLCYSDGRIANDHPIAMYAGEKVTISKVTHEGTRYQVEELPGVQITARNLYRLVKEKKELKQEDKVMVERRALVKGANTESVSHFTVLYKAGQVARYTNTICHASLRGLDGRKAYAIIDAVGAPKHRFPPDRLKSYERYAKWVIEESIVSDVFKVDTAKEYIELGSEINLDVTPGKMAFGITLIRMGSEYQTKLDTVDALHAGGISYPIAALLGMFFLDMGGTYEKSGGTNHCALDWYATIDSMVSFANGTFKFPEDKSVKDTSNLVWKVQSLMQKGNGPALYAFITEAYKSLKLPATKNGWGDATYGNPTIEQLISVAKQLEEYK